jgi:predicted nucleic acid-binding protein
MATACCFPDNTVLINFGLIDRLDLLSSLLVVRHWSLTISQECERSYDALSLSTYDDVCAIFGEALVPDRREYDTARLFQRNMLEPGDHPDKHMGEAETIAIASNRPLAATVYFVTDDRSAQDLAKANSLGVITTWDLLRVAHRKGLITFAEAWKYARILYTQRDRMWPSQVPHNDYAAFRTWISPPPTPASDASGTSETS